MTSTQHIFFLLYCLLVLCFLVVCSGQQVQTNDTLSVSTPDALENSVEIQNPDKIDPCPEVEAEAHRVLNSVDEKISQAKIPEKVRLENQKTWEDITKKLRKCIPAGKGSWMLFPSDASVEWQETSLFHEPDDGPRHFAVFKVSFTLTFLSWEGQRFFAEKSSKILAHAGDFAFVNYDVLHILDYNNDDINELIIGFEDSGHEWSNSGQKIWSFENQKVDEYSAATNIVYDSISDYDSDGRPDLIGYYGNKRNFGCGGMDPPPEGTPFILFHSTKDGSFSPSDEVAAQFLRKGCPEPPTEYFPEPQKLWEMDSLYRVSCARVWGASENEVRQALTTEWEQEIVPEMEGDPDFLPDRCISGLDLFLERAAVVPPLRLE